MLPLYKQALDARGVEANSTWLKVDNSEMYVVLPDDEEQTRALCEEFACVYTGRDVEPQYLRVVRIAVDSKKAGANVDVMFVPYFCGQIDQGRITRIG